MTAKGLKIAALIPVGLMTLVLLMFGVGEMVGGDWSGIGHFLPILFVWLVMWLSWKKPLWGGGLLLVGAGLNVIRFMPAFLYQQNNLAPLFIMILPLVLSSGLLLWAGLVEKKTAPPSPQH